MAAPVVTMQQLLETGAHFGHQTRAKERKQNAKDARKARDSTASESRGAEKSAADNATTTAIASKRICRRSLSDDQQ